MSIEFDLSGPPATPRDAATVVLLRDAPGGLEIFFVKRRADLRFMGGAYVFPGGKLDPSDLDPALGGDLDGASAAKRLGDDDAARARGLFVAAARECMEEAGVLFATRTPAAARIEQLRAAWAKAEKTFVALLADEGIDLRLSALVPWCRWVTPRGETRRFDARFFLAAAPDGASASHDEGETIASAWLTPREALARTHRGEIVLVPPTYRCVQVLAQLPDVASALAMVPDEVPILEPRVVPGDGEVLVVLPDDPLHGLQSVPHMWRDGRIDPSKLDTRFAYGPRGWRAEHVHGKSG